MKNFIIIIFCLYSFIAPVHSQEKTVIRNSIEQNQDKEEPDGWLGRQIEGELDSYLVERFLGGGAFGSVYLARGKEDGHSFAVKFYRSLAEGRRWPTHSGYSWPEPCLKPNPVLEWEAGEPMRDKEWEVGQLLDHPHIIGVVDKGAAQTDEGEAMPFLVLEYLDGKTLSEVQELEWSKELALEIAMQLTEALGYGVEQGYLFLDLHGGNLMISKERELKLIDLSSFFAVPESKEAVQGHPAGIHAIYLFQSLYYQLRQILKLGGWSRQEMRWVHLQFKETMEQAKELYVTQETLSEGSAIFSQWLEILQAQRVADTESREAA